MDYIQPVGGDPGDPYVDAVAGVTPGSRVPAQAVEYPQREIVEVINQAGLVPDNGDLTQLHAAIIALINSEIENAAVGADEVTFDNAASGLAATDVQAAIDELDGVLDAHITSTAAAFAALDFSAGNITFDNAVSGLAATDVQAALDEIDAAVDAIDFDAVDVDYDNGTSGLVATDVQAALDEIVASSSGGLIVDRDYDEYTSGAEISATIPDDDTIPQNTEGTEILSASITPKSVTNRIRVRFQCFVGYINDKVATAAAFINSNTDAARSAGVYFTNNDEVKMLCLEFEYVPGTETAQTIAIRVGKDTAATNMRLNGYQSGRLYGGTAAATLIVEEIAA